MAIRLGECRIFDTLMDAVEYANGTTSSPYWMRIFKVSNTKRPKEINDWRE